MRDDSANTMPPFFGPEWPVYPQIAGVVRVSGVAVGSGKTRVYPGFAVQYNGTSPRDRESVWVNEPNGVNLPVGYYDCRLVSSFDPGGDPRPLYAVCCC